VTPGYSEYILVNKRGHLQVEGWDSVDLADRFDTPLYVMSESQIRHNYRTFHQAFAARYPHVITAPGSKANNSLAVRRVLTQEGAGADCFGLGELFISLVEGGNPHKILLNGSDKTVDELRTALQVGVNINVDNLEELENIAELAASTGREARINIRIKPFLHDLEDKIVKDYRYTPPDISIARWAREHKFGMHPEAAFEACRRALQMKNVRLAGIHYHLKGQTPHPEYFAIMVRDVMDFVAQVKEALNWAPEQLDLGGGYSYGRREGYGPAGCDREVPSIDEYAEAMTGALKQAIDRLDLDPPTLILEPGRYIVANAGILLARVGTVKEFPGVRKWVHVDASTNHLMRVRTGNWYYHILVANKASEASEEVVDVVGPLCDAADILGHSRELPRVQRGDLIAVLDTGAYAEVWAGDFNTYPKPATVLVCGEEADVITERETIYDVLSRHRVPARLLVDQKVELSA
jgi:diaminopimelate decarboxylase